MTGTLQALRADFVAPIASFRDPMFPGVTRCLPIPPPATLRGMLAAATGNSAEPVTLGVCAHAQGGGIDVETYHPISTDGSNPAVGGRVQGGKGGMTIRSRPFLAMLEVTIWVPQPDSERIAAALRRPVWGLRLGRSQDAVFLRSLADVQLSPARDAMVGYALAPLGGHADPGALTIRLSEFVTADRLAGESGDYLWCAEGPGGSRSAAPTGTGTRRCGCMPCSGEESPDAQDGECRPPPERILSGVLAKSAGRSGTRGPETLTGHSEATRDAARSVAARIGDAGMLARHPRFWTWVTWAALLHDTGKIAAGFQLQLQPGGQPWGERHEVLSLAYVDLLTAALPEDDRVMIAAGVVFHHRCLDGRGGLADWYPPEADWKKKFGFDPDPEPGRPKTQVRPDLHAALLAWLAGPLEVQLPAPGPADRKLWERARDQLAAVQARWAGPVPDTDGLVAVLLQGAVTLADHSTSAHVQLDAATPLPSGYLKTVTVPYPHQTAAGETDGHLVLVAPTGSGKTEAGLAWASRQMESLPGLPRLAWLLPYRASIDAIRARFANDFACDPDGIGVLHATTAASLLSRAVRDDRALGPADARKARALAGAMRLFRQRVRVATPYQLLQAAIAGPKYASVLLEQANSMIVLDELHAYDPATFGRICAAMRLWEQLGSRVAVLSATLAPPMIELISDSLSGPVSVRRAASGTAPLRHRLVLDDQPLTAPGSLDRIREWLADGHSVLAVASTVATAQRVFRELAPGPDSDAALLLHSRFKLGDRAALEKRIRQRHPERRPGDPARRSGGLVVSTQALEVSLCLDFDRGASEAAPVEAIAQRAGRVNRRGRHPDGPVEFRVHAAASSRPYDDGAVEAALLALREWDGQLISEQAINAWLNRAYATSWGQAWAAEARHHRDEFAAAFLTFTEPFSNRSDFAARLAESFDTVEVLLRSDLEEYRDLASGPDGDPMLAARLLIPIRWQQKAMLQAELDNELGVWVVDAPYDPRTGLDLAPLS